MIGFFIGKLDIRRILDLDGFLNNFIIRPTRIGFVFVAVGWMAFLVIEIHIIVLEHGHAISQVSVMAQQRKRNARQMIAIFFVGWRTHMRLVPDRGLRETDMWIVGKN